MKRQPIVGDTICVEQAWEDEAGHYHDEFAEVTAINDGLMTLKFGRQDITDFLEGAEYKVEDYEPEETPAPN
jgi:hypothetical protein